MKILKILILFAAIAFAQQAEAQNVHVINNTPFSGDASFDYPGGCGSVFLSFPPSSTATGAGCNPFNFQLVVVTIQDFFCSPPMSFSVTLTLGAPTQTYTDCSGTVRTFTLSSAWPDYFVTIN